MANRPDPIEVEIDVHPDVIIDEHALRAAAAKKAGVRAREVRSLSVRRRAIDARRGRVRVRARIHLYLHATPEPPARPSPVDLPSLREGPQVAIVGAGPAGMFCAWRLAQHGIRSVVLERGRRIRGRRKNLATLSQRGELDPESNYCFGEGGAGTFSDGKLYTRSNKRGSVLEVVEAFVGYGAPRDILVDARPHIGTNRLPAVITRMREHLENAGVEFRFSTRVDGLTVTDGRVDGVSLADGSHLAVPGVVLCPGHSAHDVIDWARAAGARVVFKPFAVGVRIEHPQAVVDRIQFGSLAGHPALGAAYYRVVENSGGCGVYSFCMCPGGYIVPAASQPGRQVVNGMSPSHRRGRFANSGFVTEVSRARIVAAGFDGDDEACGLAYQASVERRAYEHGGGAFRAPAQTLRDFVDGRASSALPACSYHRGLTPCHLDAVLGDLGHPLREALRAIEHKMPGFVSDRAVAVGVESRTSAPYRIERDPEQLQALGVDGLYPSGEGAGYAGGIVSAAIDGIRVADAVARARR